MELEMSILERLRNSRVFGIEYERGATRREDDRFIITELCDDCFDESLTRDEIRALAAEILDLADFDKPIDTP